MAYVQNRYDPRLQRVLDDLGWDKISLQRVNEWVDSPGAALMRMKGLPRDPAGVSAWVGNAFESGSVTGAAIPDLSIDECVAGGLKQLRHDTALMPREEREKLLRQTAERIRTGVTELRNLGVPEMVEGWVPFSTDWDHQFKIHYEPEWSPLPIEGWVDAVFPVEGVMVDTKAPVNSMRARASWMRQGALYAAGTNYEFRILAVLPDSTRGPTKGPRYQWHTLTNPAEHLEYIKHVIGAMCRVLTLSDDLEEVASYIVPDFDHFRFSGPVMQAGAQELFGYSKPAVQQGEGEE